MISARRFAKNETCMNDRRNTILVLASIGTFVEALDIAIINLTIPAIQRQFLIDHDTVQWLQTLYVLFFGGFLIIGGKLSDQIGCRKVFLIGGTVFLLASFAAGISPNFPILAIARAAQGLGAALLMPASLATVTHTFVEPAERSRAIGIFSSFAAIGSGSGLSVGGLISTYWSWHWVFLINVPILAVTLLLALTYFPKERPSATAKNSDMLSGILLVIGLLFLTFGIHDLTHFQQRPYVITACFVGAFLLLTLFVQRLRTAKQPLISLDLFRHRSLVISNLSFFMLGALFIGFLLLVSLMLQDDMGYSSASAGLLLVPFSVLSALIAKFLIPILSRKFAPAKLGILGMCCMFCGLSLLLIAIYMHHPLVLVLGGAACISGIGMTICFTSLSILGVKDVDPRHYGMASSLTSTSYFLGAGIGLSFISFLGQWFPSSFAVGPIGLIVLLCYALFAIVLLVHLAYVDRRILAKTLQRANV